MNHIPALQTLYGKRVQVTYPMPKIQVRSSFEWITKECRDSMNAYLVKNFGFHKQPDEIYEFKQANTLVIPEHIYRKLVLVGELK